VLRIISDIYNDTNKYIPFLKEVIVVPKNCILITYLIIRLNEAGEIIIKTMSDYWVIGKLSNLREFFVVIQQKSASIIEIDGKYNTFYAFYDHNPSCPGG
jgi:hypothetical protein